MARQLHLTCRVNPESLALKPKYKRQIMQYVANAPNSSDTFRGIVEWWFLKQEIAHNTAEIRKALEELTAEGKLSAWTGPDGQMHYRLPEKAVKRRPKNN